MKTSIKTTIIFINKRTREIQKESFYSSVSTSTSVSEQLKANTNYWKFYIGTHGGHKVLDCQSNLVAFR